MKLAQSLLNFFEENGIVEYTILKKDGKIQVEFEAEDIDVTIKPYNLFGDISGMIPQWPAFASTKEIPSNSTEIKEEEPQTETVVSEEHKNDIPTEVPVEEKQEVEEKHETSVKPDEPDIPTDTKTEKKKYSKVNPSRVGKIHDINNPEFYKQRSIPNLSVDPNLENYIKEALENGISSTCRKYGLASSSLTYHVNKYKKKMGEEKATKEETKPEIVTEEVEKISDDSPVTNDVTLYKEHNFTEEELKYIKLYLKRKIKPAQAANILGMNTKDFNLLASQYARAKNITGDKKNPPVKKKVEEKPKFNTANLADGWHILPEDGMFHEIKNGLVVK